MPYRNCTSPISRRFALWCAFLLFGAGPIRAVTIETVPVGNPGNLPLNGVEGGPGAVEYEYRIGKYEVTNAQYVEFLNSVDPAGLNTLRLYSSSMSTDVLGGIVFSSIAINGQKYEVKSDRGRNPVVFVSYYDALRFTNWLHNGQGSVSTESGAYTLLGGTPRPTNYQELTRGVGAKWWLPNYYEINKAAFHKNDGATANYWNYPFSSNAIPSSDQPPGSDAPAPANTANFFQNDQMVNGYDDGYAVTASPSLVNTQNYLTNVGAYPHSQSPYGALDLGGNAAEWCQTDGMSSCGTFGGAWAFNAVALRGSSGSSTFSNLLNEDRYTGFRVAAFPEPTSGLFQRLAVDFDSTNACFCNEPSTGPVLTQTDFRSWNTSWAFNSPTWTGARFLSTQFLTEGVEFELQAFRPGPAGLEAPNYLGSRIRPGGQGDPEYLLRDFVFAEGTEGTFLYLTISGLPVGSYRMTTWHYDRLEPGIAMQIEVGDKQGSMIAAATDIVVDQFLLGTSPQMFEFQVESSDIIKEIVFRSDNSRFRTRLNGFTLVRIPEPPCWLHLLAMMSLGFFLGRYRCWPLH